MSTSLFEHYKAALRRGHMAALAGDLDEALEAYDEAARLVPGRSLPLASRGAVLHRLDRWAEAAEAFDRALQLAPDDEVALRARASARADRGLRSGAAADFERLAFVLDVAGRATDAADAARRAADLEPTAAREALADRLGAAAAHLADLTWGRSAAAGIGAGHDAGDDAGDDDAPDGAVDTQGPGPEPPAHAEPGPEAAAELEAAWTAMAERATAEHREAARGKPAVEAHVDLGAYDALEALRAGFEAEDRAGRSGAPAAGVGRGAEAEPDEVAPADIAPAAIQPADAAGTAAEAAPDTAAGSEPGDHAWPGIDLPSPPPAPLEGELPDPEELLAKAADVLEGGEPEAARDLMLTAARVHREAGRTDAALDVCLNLLSVAPGDPRVHLAIANLQLDRGWKGVATEKLDLLARFTSLTGDTQAAADVHGLASERLRDDPAGTTAAR